MIETPAPAPTPAPLPSKAESPKNNLVANPSESRIFFSQVEKKLGKTQILSMQNIKWLMRYVLPPNLDNLKQKYRLSENNGFRAEKFHSNCMNIAPLMVLCQSMNGSIFGGVSYVPFNVEGARTNRNLIFSLDKGTVHYLKSVNGSKESTEAIKYDETCGPIFGNNDLVIGNDCHVENSCSSDLGNSYDFVGEGTTFLTGSHKFSLKKAIFFEMIGCNTDPVL